MNFKATIVQLYYMLIYSDGKVNPDELEFGKKMIRAEGISEAEFERHLGALRGKEAGHIYKESLSNLRRLKKPEQVRCIAWLCVLANSDGFMDRAEWQFIYKVYHKELKLPLDEIMEVQKQLAYSTRDALFVRPVGQSASPTTSRA